MSRRLLCSLIAMFMFTAQPGVSQDFDITPVTLQGKFAGLVAAPEQPTYILLEITDGNGKSETWAVQGSPLIVLMQNGWTPRGPVSLGKVISVATFRAKAGAKLAESLPKGTADKVLELAKAGRVVRGTEVTLATGKRLTFGRP